MSEAVTTLEQQITSAIQKLIGALNLEIEEASSPKVRDTRRAAKLKNAAVLAQKLLELHGALKQQQLAGEEDLSPYQKYIKGLGSKAGQEALIALRDEIRRALKSLSDAGRASTGTSEPEPAAVSNPQP